MWAVVRRTILGRGKYDKQSLLDPNNSPSSDASNKIKVQIEKSSWTASIVWFGPYRNRKAAVEGANKLSSKQNLLNFDNDSDKPTFGLYAAVGYLKDWRAPWIAEKLLYIGINKDGSESTLSSRIESSSNLNTIEEFRGTATYWIGLVESPRLKMHNLQNETSGTIVEIGKGDDAEETESGLIFSLNPLLNKNAQLNAPQYSFDLRNQFVAPLESNYCEKFDWLGYRYSFRNLMPDRIVYNRPQSQLEYHWPAWWRLLMLVSIRKEPPTRKIKDERSNRWRPHLSQRLYSHPFFRRVSSPVWPRVVLGLVLFISIVGTYVLTT